MNTTRYREWFARRIQIAELLMSEQDIDAGFDAEILLCCATSALAAIMWPGRRIDRDRFTQFLVDFAPESAGVQRISIPVLVAKLRDDDDTTSAQTLISEFYPSSDAQILNANEIDQPETAVRAVLPELPLQVARESSYAGIIYSDLRCALVHEYRLSSYLASFRMSDREDVPSYVNMLLEPDEEEVNRIVRQFGVSETMVRSAVTRVVRHLYIPFQYIRDTLNGAAEAAFDHWDAVPFWEQPSPQSWWIRGEHSL